MQWLVVVRWCGVSDCWVRSCDEITSALGAIRAGSDFPRTAANSRQAVGESSWLRKVVVSFPPNVMPVPASPPASHECTNWMCHWRPRCCTGVRSPAESYISGSSCGSRFAWYRRSTNMRDRFIMKRKKHCVDIDGIFAVAGLPVFLVACLVCVGYFTNFDEPFSPSAGVTFLGIVTACFYVFWYITRLLVKNKRKWGSGSFGEKKKRGRVWLSSSRRTHRANWKHALRAFGLVGRSRKKVV